MTNFRHFVLLVAINSMAASVQADIYDVLRKDGGSSQRLSSSNVGGSLDSPLAPPAPTGGNNAGASNNTNSLNLKDTAPPEAPKTTLRDEAFRELVNRRFPLTTDQIITLHRKHDESQRAVHTHPYAPPQPVSSTLTVDLSPGATPPVVRLAGGFVTSMVFVDSSGQPWPVLDYSLGNPEGFDIQWDTKTNTLFMQSKKEHISGNMAVRLDKLDTPVMLSLVTGQKEVDYRVDIQVPGQGPNALPPVVESLPQHGTSNSLLAVLDGIPPVGSIELSVAGGHGRAWVSGSKMVFRTKLTLLSPAWSATVSSADGTRVYELTPTPLLLASKNGKPIKVELTGL